MADLALWADIGDEVRKGVAQAKDQYTNSVSPGQTGRLPAITQQCPN